MKNYKDLIVWQKAIDLVEEIYRITSFLPSDELYGLSSQLKRAAVSIPSNIAEGYERNTTKEYIRFLSIAKASRAEIETQLYICKRLNFLSDEDIKKALDLSEEIKRIIISMLKSLNKENY